MGWLSRILALSRLQVLNLQILLEIGVNYFNRSSEFDCPFSRSHVFVVVISSEFDSEIFFLNFCSSLPPSKQEISNLEKRCNGIPLKFCNIEHGRVSFFSFNSVELPLLP